MLTTKVITPKQGESYYAKENYYSTEESVKNSQWMGKGATKLGLKGKVKPKQFKKLLYGQLPNGTNFRRRKKERDGYKERAGLDCTFSAPKSVSILALVEGRKELEKAHRTAVLDTLKIIERDYATTRVSKGGKSTVINTGNLVVGQFHHDTSRELDPHLHTHCVILNMTEHNDRWYAFRNDDIHANKKLLGMIYQNQLAIQVKKLGYEIEPKEHGQFEIKGFTEEQLQSFSKRRQQIKSQLKEESTWFEREKVWDKTRSKKGESIPREELQNYWRKEYEAQNVSYPQPNKAGKKVKREGLQHEVTPETPHLTIDVNQAVAEAIEHCSERSCAFKPEDIQKFILTEVGKYEHHELEQAITTNDELIHLDKQVTTQTALLREIATIKLVKDGQDKVKPLTDTEIVDEFIERKGLTEGQRQAVILASTTGDQIIAWQGKAGAGKTHALNEFKQIAEREGCVVKGFAPSAKAAKVLAEELNIKTTTVARKLVSHSWKDKTEQQQIWIVDEAGLLGASDAYNLLKKASAENARVLLVGDTRQLSSVSAGNPFKSLQQAGIATAYLEESLRQKTKDLKHAVNLLSNGKVAEGINVLETNNRILEIKDAPTRASQIAIDYLKLTPDERKDTLIIAGTHQEREAIINRIREGLKAEGSLGKEVKAFRLKSKNLTLVQKKYAHYYEQGNIVIPLANYKRLGLEKNQHYLVKAVEKDALVLVGSDGQSKKVSPTWFKHKEVYEAIETNIAVGDRLRWGKNDKQLNRINGGEFVVTKIYGGTATIESETGKQEQIDLKTPQHLDHALVSTTYSSQGVTANRVIVSATNDFTLSIESFYVATSRAKYNLHLYVENKTKLIEKAQTSRSQANPLELIREHQQKEVVTNKTTSTRVKEQNTNQTVQENYERDRHSQPNTQRDSDRSTRTNPPKIRRDRNQSQQPNRNFRDKSQQPNGVSRIEPPRLATRVGQLSDGINQYIEQKETEERITQSIESLDNLIRNRFLPNSRIRQFYVSITEYIVYQEQQQQLNTLVNTFKNYLEGLEADIIDTSEQLESEEISDAVNQLNEQPENFTATAPLPYSIILEEIMLNLNQVNPAELEILKLKTEKLSEQLKQLDNSKPQANKRKQQVRKRDYLKKQLANIQAYTQFSVGQKVTVNEQIGTITDLKLSPGGMPIAWVQWDGYPISIPEQPNRLELFNLETNSHLQEKHESTLTPQQFHRTDSQDPERFSDSISETISRENKQPGGQIERGRIQSSPPTTTRGVDQSSSTTDQSVKSDARTTRPKLRATEPTPTEARPGIVVDVGRVDVSRRILNGSSQELGRSIQQHEQVEQRFRRTDQQNGRVQQRFRDANQEYTNVSEKFRELAKNARDMPLEEVAQRLGLQPDPRTPNQYKVSQVYTISIDKQRFYDHIAQKGGGGAIDLVMHVQDSSFFEAVEWLNSNTVNLTPITQVKNSSSKQPLERQPFEPPVPDESKWRAVKDYLVNTRKLPESTIDYLHKNGSIYADSKQNVVFIRKNMASKITGASLRGTYNDSTFKGLAKGTIRDTGWFALRKGQGELERIVLTESPIDAISAAAVSQSQKTTLFISTDGAGSIPHEFLQHELNKDKQVLVAYDNDEAGHTMARAVLDKLPGSHRVTPKLGKDWNEQILYSQGSKEQKRHIFRQEYEKLRAIVDSNPNLANEGIGDKDLAVAMLILKAEAKRPTGEDLIDRVGKVLSQSDQLREWKQSTPEKEFRSKVKEYILDKFQQARYLRENIRAERERNQDIEFER